ncbi:DUF134 domain-containing protein [Aminipila sp.]|uniref:DUF134 domain-containing protein n=1 Tax=Aminipila sp. TaxID=2060095 RepID=UPI0028A274DE|nr:DUF134 domain-containing protein [Aminipila sp.]
MPRPRKCRKVCSLPEKNVFVPLNSSIFDNEVITMTVEEYETIRLIDFEGLMQEECADRMNVARTTVQRIYNDARKKMSKFLIEGCILKIEGGDYQICNENDQKNFCGHCHKYRFGQNIKETNNTNPEDNI